MADKAGPSDDWVSKFAKVFGTAWSAYQSGPISAAARWAYTKYGDKVFAKGDDWLKKFDKTFSHWKKGTYANWKVPYYAKKVNALPVSGWEDTPGSDPAEWKAIYDKQQYGGDDGALASFWKMLFGVEKLPAKYKIMDLNKFSPNSWNFFIYNTFTLPFLVKVFDRNNYNKSYTAFADRFNEYFADAKYGGAALRDALFRYMWNSVKSSPSMVAWWYKNIMPYQMLVPWWMLKYVVSAGWMTAKAAAKYGPYLAKPISALSRLNNAGHNATERTKQFLKSNLDAFLNATGGAVKGIGSKGANLLKFIADRYSSYYARNSKSVNLLGAKRARSGGATSAWNVNSKPPARNVSLLYRGRSAKYPDLSGYSKKVYKGEENNNINYNMTSSNGNATMNSSFFDELQSVIHTDDEMPEPEIDAGGPGDFNHQSPPSAGAKLKLPNKGANATKVVHNWYLPGLGPVTKYAFDLYKYLLEKGYDRDAAVDIVREDAVEDWQVPEDYAVEDEEELKRWKYASYSNENWNSAMIAAPKRRRGRFNLNNYKRSFYSFRRKKNFFQFDLTPFKLSCSFRAWHVGDYNGAYSAASSVRSDMQWFRLLAEAENDATNLVDVTNYSECITGGDIMNRIMQDNTVTAPIWKMFNLFCLKGVAIKISCSRRAVANSANVYPSSANYVLALYWGKTDPDQLPVPGANQTKYDYLFDKDNAMRFTTTNVDLRPYSKYFRANYDSMGWGGSTWNSIEVLNTAPFLVCLENQQEYFAELSPIFDVTFDVYIMLKSKNA